MVLACILIQCKPGTATNTLNIIKDMKGVIRAFETLGSFDIVVEYEFQSLEKLGIVVYEIAKIPGVVSTETLIETLL
ncbi:MAG: Lrp/AsnC ligand binding domain-containing protein [Candidatus Methanomethylicaceae archaeon]